MGEKQLLLPLALTMGHAVELLPYHDRRLNISGMLHGIIIIIIIIINATTYLRDLFDSISRALHAMEEKEE
jgi:hypothetical protein